MPTTELDIAKQCLRGREAEDNFVLRMQRSTGWSRSSSAPQCFPEIESLSESDLCSYTEEQLALYRRLGREAEDIWFAIVCKHMLLMVFSPSSRHEDIMKPALALLEEFKEAISALYTM